MKFFAAVCLAAVCLFADFGVAEAGRGAVVIRGGRRGAVVVRGGRRRGNAVIIRNRGFRRSNTVIIGR